MGKLVDSVLDGSCFVAPNDTRVLQAIDVDGRVVGESFEFVGHPKPHTEGFKAEIRLYYPNARFKKLKAARDAVGISTWCSIVGGWTPSGGKPPLELEQCVREMKAKWESGPLYRGNQAQAEHRLSLAQRVIAGTITEAEALAEAKRYW